MNLVEIAKFLLCNIGFSIFFRTSTHFTYFNEYHTNEGELYLSSDTIFWWFFVCFSLQTKYSSHYFYFLIKFSITASTQSVDHIFDHCLGFFIPLVLAYSVKQDSKTYGKMYLRVISCRMWFQYLSILCNVKFNKYRKKAIVMWELSKNVFIT